VGVILKQTIKSSIFSYLGIALGFLTAGILIPKSLSTAEVGLTKVLTAYSIILIQFSSLGYSNAIVRFFPFFKDSEKKHNGFLAFSMLIFLGGFALCVGFLYFAHNWILAAQHRSMSDMLQGLLGNTVANTSNSDSELFAVYYWLLIPLVFFQLYFNMFDNYCRAMYDSVTGVFLKEFFQKFMVLVAVGLYWFGWVGFEGFMAWWALSNVLPAVLIILKIWRDGNFSLHTGWHEVLQDKQLRKQIISFSLYSVITGLSTNIISQIDQIMVHNYLTLSAAGIYGTCMLFGEVIAKPANSVYRISTTVVVEAWKHEDLRLIADVYSQSCINQLIFGVLVYMGIVANLDNVFQILPPDYASGRWVIIIFGLGKLFDMATGVNGVILNTSRYYRYDTYFFVLLIFLVIALNKWLIPLYGMNGAAMAAALGYGLFNAFRTLFVYFKFGMFPFSWHNGAVIAVAGFTYYLSTLVPPIVGTVFKVPVFDLTLRSIFISILFIGLIYAFKLSPEINKQLDKIRKRG
jgi:O-antigen/teichoic acid export membrane protein